METFQLMRQAKERINDMLKKNLRKYKIIEKHIDLVRQGKYEEAKNLLHLLRKGQIRLGLGNVDFNTECFLESIDCPVRYSRNGYSATFRI